MVKTGLFLKIKSCSGNNGQKKSDVEGTPKKLLDSDSYSSIEIKQEEVRDAPERVEINQEQPSPN
jgi:hypothetical protein